ncbi:MULTISPECIES: manganese catalase family protein [unclassified Candidatus Frackibacter]|uniref:manganese catalase family protein n=1 Tax=unclassified Candidatus Frackibacter TaxID=2648818 RepID=UPI0007931131|nr:MULTISPECIES: manganese catalase family protein [unclassified Candidatus Frackibacter]KXS44932.1 MAG: Mn-containing catalase [Candidatus Frackibacter sp. T328-2]SDB97217.1 Mn-containing catalase [Candidatus Frackibacter sp. WG11]SEM28891.1 Mn-containing catalase [Candidatus Frackibacter sp. WG12]SFL33737.1 Mn-containing catalase [Candidatus Frackibacter sp. WG13]
MFNHDKELLHEVKVDQPNPAYAAMLQEQLGGANGELKAGLQYFSQSFRIQDPEIKDVFLDIAAEEFSHAEMVAQMITMLNGHDVANTNDTVGQIESQVLGGLSPMLANASGTPFTGNFINVTGDIAADILSNIAAEQRAKVVYEYLYRQIDDQGVRETIDFLLNREEAHNALFREALNKVQQNQNSSNYDFGVTEDSRLYFDLSTPGRYFDNPNPTPPSFSDPQGDTQTHTFNDPGMH